MRGTIPISVEQVARGVTRWDALAVLLTLGLLVFFAEASRHLLQPLSELRQAPLSLAPENLPEYAARTTLRMLLALALSLIFTFTYATLAAKSRRAEVLLVPLLDILQSVPILGFISVTVVFFMSLAPGRVLGLDLSENMIARARRDTTDPAIEYGIADLDHLILEAGAFDVAYSSLAFHYVEDFDRLIRAIHEALVPGSHLVFTIEHPIYMASLNPGWQVDEDGRKRWPVDQYSVEGRRTTDWLAKGVVKYHRTIGTTLNALINGGFAIRHVDEWHPTPAQIDANPALAEEMERPMILIVDAQR